MLNRGLMCQSSWNSTTYFIVLEDGEEQVKSLVGKQRKTPLYKAVKLAANLNIKEYCYPCIQDAVQQVINECPGKSDAQIWYDYCTVRYSQDNFFGMFDASQNALVRNQDDYKDPESYELGPLFEDIISKAVEHASGGIGTGKVDLPDSHTLYGAAQCTTDPRPFDCAQCLGAAVKEFDDFCKPKRGCRVYLSSCAVRYEIYNFLPPMMLGLRRFKVKLWKS
ncbi:LOW QUALITY PROTEIN: hypothetical protein Cgig2_007277 [Carnegiea gigantea]|uniref:Gnk2-homologous domain-containing protein n=1 Tax=Carnegiea gigantea TaxID=171969 RepID=A0A9Q1KZK1_9CARY|nr:LOW QUALITY PROTEIN: hypothetical protein Cgig2_007277 [Carnegiea gigantea]